MERKPRPPSADQLIQYALKVKEIPVDTTSAGNPVDSETIIKTIGPHGPVPLEDTYYLDKLFHFSGERNPERVVHAKGGGAFGYFEVTHDITHLTKAAIFSEIGKQTPVAARFSTVWGERGSADTNRDPRGFAVKFYTEDGNWDLVGNNTPIFFVRDPFRFIHFIHSQKRNPVTHLRDWDAFWDFISLLPETTHQVMILFSDRGIPDGFRHMHGYGSHTFKLVNKDNEPVYCKFHFRTDQGIKNISPQTATKLAATDPDYSIRDLYDNIARGNFPSWTFYIQVMTFEEAKTYRWNPFDVTKIWPQSDFPLLPVGHMVLDKNPGNYYAEIEQLAFNPNNLIPGIEPTPDKMLQGRLHSYIDTHIHRLGANFNQIPVNCPYRVRVANYQRDAPMAIDNQNGAPNYYPNSFKGPEPTPRGAWSTYNATGDVKRYKTEDEDNFSQPRILWSNVLDDAARDRMTTNIASVLKLAAPFIQERTVKMFSQVHPDFGNRLRSKLPHFQESAEE
ncbi:hypothetical protein M8J75_008183 [Diaphorina citri]|nr:hypothetical protein M8J75_008183 [Diaphorina citri]KAI5734510.1 hypothetical protein M8J77_007374 [Diaphorina citri]